MTKELEQLYINRIEALRDRVDYLENIIAYDSRYKSKLKKLVISCGIFSKHKMDRPNKLGKVKDLLDNEREV